MVSLGSRIARLWRASRHGEGRKFALAHAAIGAGAILALAGWSLFAGPPVGPLWVWAGALAVPFALAGLALCVPWLGLLQSASSLSATVFVTGLAALSGGLTSPFLPWLLVLPAEAALVRRMGHFLVVLAAACLAIGALMALALSGHLPPSRVPADWQPALIGVSLIAAVLYGGALVLQIRRDQAAEERSRAAADASVRFLDDHVGDIVLRVADAETNCRGRPEVR